MLSKVKIWEINQKLDSFFSINEKKVQFLLCNDPFIEQIIKSKINWNDQLYRTFFGTEITNEFIEDNFENLNFFSEPSNLVIFEADKIEKKLLEKIFAENFNTENGNIYLFFNSNRTTNDFLKKIKSEGFEIEEMKSWENQKVLKFLLNEKKIKLNFECENFILENKEPSVESYMSVINELLINFSDEELTLNNLKNLIVKDRYEFFDLLDIYHQDRKKFLIIFSRKSLDFDWMRQFATSMESHLIKVLYPDEIKKKDRPSKYDQNILRWSELESREKLKYDLSWFARINIEAKSRNEFLKESIRLEILK